MNTNSQTTSYGSITHVGGAACHNGPKKAFSWNGINVWAGSHRELQGDLDWALRIRISDNYGAPFDTQVKLSNGAEKIFSEKLTVRKVPPTIDIEWPDFEAPDMDFAWWDEVAQGILKFPAGTDIVVYCMGGHGRTGTALSILALLMGAVPEKEDVVLWLRDKYCSKIVESQAQIQYIEDITGVRIIAKTSFIWGAGVLDYGSGTTLHTAGNAQAKGNERLIGQNDDTYTGWEAEGIVDAGDDTDHEELWTDPKTQTRWLVRYNKAGDVTTMRLDPATQGSLPLVTGLKASAKLDALPVKPDLGSLVVTK